MPFRWGVFTGESTWGLLTGPIFQERCPPDLQEIKKSSSTLNIPHFHGCFIPLPSQTYPGRTKIRRRRGKVYFVCPGESTSIGDSPLPPPPPTNDSADGIDF